MQIAVGITAAVAFVSPVAADELADLMVRRIDTVLAEAWTKADTKPAAPASDAEFLRRVSLDLTGVIPAYMDARDFLESRHPHKRQKLVETLLRTQRHAFHLSNQWRRAMLPDGVANRQADDSLRFQWWLQRQFYDNVPYDRTVQEILTANVQSTRRYTIPIAYYTALEYQPIDLAASSARMFLGVRLECARCHDHPFADWSTEDFWGVAAFFAGVDKTKQKHFGESNEIHSVLVPGTNQAVYPKYLGNEVSIRKEDGPPRQQLARWVTKDLNPYFAKATVNRVWAHLFGRGLVEPVDDLGPHNPASHPEILEDLAAYFVDSGFDLRKLFLVLMRTRAYQLSSRRHQPVPAELFACMRVKPLSAEEFYDSVEEALRLGRARPAGGRFTRTRFDDARRRAFLEKFQSPSGGENDLDLGLVLALKLMNGYLHAESRPSGRNHLISRLAGPHFDENQVIQALFISVLSRLPSPQESRTFAPHLQAAKSRRTATSDLLWALLNTTEFAVNH